jgi:hypothetical protein
VRAAESANLIPVYRELCADSDTPVSAYAALGGGEYSFLLESVVGGATWAAYSFVGVAPRAVLTWRGRHRQRDLVRRRRRRAAEDRGVARRRSAEALAEVMASAAGGRRRGCRGSGAAPSGGSPTTACARSRICRRGRKPGVGGADRVHGDHRHRGDLRQPAPDLKVVATPYVRGPSAPPPPTIGPARASTRSSRACAGRARRSSRWRRCRAPRRCRRRAPASSARPSSRARSIASRSTCWPATRSRWCCRSASTCRAATSIRSTSIARCG